MDQLRPHRSGGDKYWRKYMYRVAFALYILEIPPCKTVHTKSRPDKGRRTWVRVWPEGLEKDPLEEALEDYDHIERHCTGNTAHMSW